MCGELEEDGSDVEEILYDRFAAHVQSFLASMKSQGSDSTLNGHLDSLFRESLKRSADNTSAPETVGGYERPFAASRGSPQAGDGGANDRLFRGRNRDSQP